MKHLISALLLVIVVVAPVRADDAVTLMTEEFAPYQFYEEGRDTTTGLSVEIVAEIQEKLGTDYPLKVYPWSRGLKILNTRENAALF